MAHKVGCYARELGDLYDDIPKSVLAAIAVSFASRGGDFPEEAPIRIAREWKILQTQGIVSQEPTRLARSIAAILIEGDEGFEI